MIGWRSTPSTEEVEKPRGFDDFDLRLGDLMRGERATLGRSLLDVQRELKIKATYIAAIENCDVSAFETQGFIAGYVRSYARFLGMDPEWAFAKFCTEANFQTAHGMSQAASSKPLKQRAPLDGRDPLSDPNASFVPRGESVFANVEPRAIGSLLVLALLIGGIGYGGWSVVREIQRVQVAPIDQAPLVVAEMDPLGNVSGDRQVVRSAPPADNEDVAENAPQSFDRIYRPDALDVPVLVSRDGPIAAIDPRSEGALADAEPRVAEITEVVEIIPTVQVVEAEIPTVELLAVRPAWVRVQTPEGTVLFEKILDAGERYVVPQMEEPAVLRAGNSGSVYFAVNGQTFGPAAPGAQVVKNVQLSPEALTESYALANLDRDPDLASFVNVAEVQPVQDLPKQ